jgi:CheY-like chemotaxis protein
MQQGRCIMIRVMLVEDDSTMRALLTTLIDLEGFETHSFGAIKDDELLTQIKTIQPAALLMDIHLENSSGLDAVQKIKQDKEICDVAVAMISGEDLAAESLSAGADYFILKPFDTENLIDWLKRASQ